jgi:hypothetical protein
VPGFQARLQEFGKTKIPSSSFCGNFRKSVAGQGKRDRIASVFPMSGGLKKQEIGRGAAKSGLYRDSAEKGAAVCESAGEGSIAVLRGQGHWPGFPQKQITRYKRANPNPSGSKI